MKTRINKWWGLWPKGKATETKTSISEFGAIKLIRPCSPGTNTDQEGDSTSEEWTGEQAHVQPVGSTQPSSRERTTRRKSLQTTYFRLSKRGKCDGRCWKSVQSIKMDWAPARHQGLLDDCDTEMKRKRKDREPFLRGLLSYRMKHIQQSQIYCKIWLSALRSTKVC